MAPWNLAWGPACVESHASALSLLESGEQHYKKKKKKKKK